MNRFVWWASLALIGTAAAGITAWSLYVVAHDIYGVPAKLAILTAAVFDGAAIACLYLANEAAKEARSALGPHFAALGLAGVSVYLNRLHAGHIHGGTGATLLFAAPTIALMLITGLAWSAVRSRQRTAHGERPVTLPHYGVWGWLLAREEAWTATKQHAVNRVTSSASAASQPHQPAVRHSASAVLREHFAGMDPADAIRFAHSAKPTTPPADLAAELTSYGVHVSAVQVALVLGHVPARITVERDDAPDAPQVRASAAPNKSEAIVDAASALGPDAKAADIVKRVKRITGLTVDAPYVRTVLSRKRSTPGVGQGGEGYN